MTGKFEDWLLDSLSILNGEGKLAPAKAAQRRVRELLEDTGWAKVREGLTAFGFGDAVAGAEAVAESCPDFPELLKSEAGQAAISEFFERHSTQVAELHGTMVRLMRLTPPTFTLSITDDATNPAWNNFWGGILSSKEGGNVRK